MIAKITTGKGFAGLIDYADDIENKNTNIIDSEGLVTSNPKAMAACMHLQARSNPKVKNYVGHCMLSFSPKDMPRLTDAFVRTIARDYLRRMGIVNTQFAIYRHHDQPHDHVHIVYNRVDNNAQELPTDHNFRRSARITKKLTREYGLTFGKGKDDVRRERLHGRDAVKYRMYDTISPLLQKVTSFREFEDRLAKLGINFNLYYDKDGKARGISFSDGQTSFSGAKIDRSLSYWAIDNTIRRNATLAEQVAMENDELAVGHSSKPTYEVADGNDNQESVATQVATAVSAETEGILGAVEDAASGFNSAASSIGEAIAEVVNIATTVQQTPGGGGGGSSKLDGDDDKNKRKPRRGRGGR